MATKRMTPKSTSSSARRSSSAAMSSYDDNMDIDSSSDVGSSDESVGSSRQSTSRLGSGLGNKNAWKDFISNPAVRYVAGGIATALLTKVASNFSTRYPEISRFINENLDNVEGRLAEFKNGLNNTSENSRH